MGLVDESNKSGDLHLNKSVKMDTMDNRGIVKGSVKGAEERNSVCVCVHKLL